MSQAALPTALPLALALALAQPAAAGTEVHAHRGGAALAPENSLRAFRGAIELGVDGLELDLRLTRDGVLIVHHDARLDDDRCRDAAGTEPPRSLISETDWDALHAFRCDGEPVPRFRDVLALVSETNAPVGLTVEIKMKGEDADRLRPQQAWRVLSELDRASMSRRTLIQSFDEQVLALIESMRPEQHTGLLVRDEDGAIDALERSGADALLVRHDELSRGLVAAAHARGARVFAWTVNDRGRFDELASWGVDAVITDRPGDMLAAAGRLEAAAQVAVTPVRVIPEAPSFDEPALELGDIELAAVIPFTSRGRVDTFCTSLFEEAAREKEKIPFPELVDLYRLPVSIVDGKPFQPRGVLDTLIVAAREAGAQAIVVGEGNWYGPFGNRWRMEIRIIEVNQGRTLWTTTAKSGPAISGPQAKGEVVRKLLRDYREDRRRRG